jgi:hypothetical protein
MLNSFLLPFGSVGFHSLHPISQKITNNGVTVLVLLLHVTVVNHVSLTDPCGIVSGEAFDQRKYFLYVLPYEIFVLTGKGKPEILFIELRLQFLAYCGQFIPQNLPSFFLNTLFYLFHLLIDSFESELDRRTIKQLLFLQHLVCLLLE